MGNCVGKRAKNTEKPNQNTLQISKFNPLARMLAPLFQNEIKHLCYSNIEWNQIVEELLKIRENPDKNFINERQKYYEMGNQITQEEQFMAFKIYSMSQKEINQIIRYEHIQEEIERITTWFYFKKQEMESTTRNIQNVFLKCFQLQKNILANRNYFSFQNGLEAARFAREGCNHQNRAVFIFLNFAVKQIGKLITKGCTLQTIEEATTALINTISQLYPPGKDLIGNDENLKKTLKEIQIQWDKEKYPLRNNFTIDLTKKSHKKEQLQKGIIEVAKISRQELPHLQNLIRSTCLEKCVQVDSNLKLNPDEIIQKKLVRIFQKLLLKKSQQQLLEEQQQLLMKQNNNLSHQKQIQIQENYQKNIKTILKNSNTDKQAEKHLKIHLIQQTKAYEQKIQKQLSDRSSIEFSITDMARGRCTFAKIEDIIETIEKIKQYVDEQNQTHADRYRILEIQSRFTKPIPISDITLKIALNQRIVAELQLTLQDNAATYAFAHQVYELQRSKAYSKVKTVFNSYDSLKEEFSDLLLKQLSISSSLINVLIGNKQNHNHKVISDLGPHVIEFFQLGKAQNYYLKRGQDPKIQMNEKERALVEAVFDRTMLKTHKQKGSLFRKYLKSAEQDMIFKTSLFYQLVKDVNVAKNHHQIEYNEYNYQLKNKIFLDQKEFEQIETLYLNTIRMCTKKEQIQFLLNTFYKQYNPPFEKLADRVYDDNEKIKWLIKQGIIFEEISQFNEAIKCYEKALEINKTIICQKDLALSLKFNYSRILIKLGKFEQASKLIAQLQYEYKETKKYKSAIQCIDLLSEIHLKQGKQKESQKIFEKAKKMAEMHKINFGGLQIAHCEWRKGQYLFQNGKKDKALDTHLNIAFEEYSEYLNGSLMMDKVKQFWGEYQKTKMPEPKLRENKKILSIYVNPSMFNNQESFYRFLKECKWTNLSLIFLEHAQITDQGCRQLVEAQWPNLETLILNWNKITDKGCKYLVEGEWPKLSRLQLYGNQIADEGCKYLTQGQWPKLKQVFLNSNLITDQGCKFLCEGQWPNLSAIFIFDNKTTNNKEIQALLKAKFNDCRVDIY